MANRSAAISERRAAREKRREQVAREKAEKLAVEEAERQRAEREAREALAAQKREERRLAKQVSSGDVMLVTILSSCFHSVKQRGCRDSSCRRRSTTEPSVITISPSYETWD